MEAGEAPPVNRLGVSQRARAEAPMALVAPSILSADFGRLGDEVRDVLAKGADWIHVDVMDGHFVPNITFGPPIVRAVRAAAGSAVVDVHLMIESPDRYLQDFRDAGADVITVHAEACTHLHRTLQAIRATGAKAGVSLNPHTPPAVLEYVLDLTDLVLLMTVNPGFGGQSLIESVIPKIRVVRGMLDAAGSSAHIEIDGGVKTHNAHRFTAAGADVLVSGSGVFKADDRAAAIAAIQAAQP
ncbi:MAG: ribulose-phosphate 3-epimerase [Myxococcota bacterium]|jgi:ribulose-phosphate 3-epimerase